LPQHYDNAVVRHWGLSNEKNFKKFGGFVGVFANVEIGATSFTKETPWLRSLHLSRGALLHLLLT
jgi:hypothetical protein